MPVCLLFHAPVKDNKDNRRDNDQKAKYQQLALCYFFDSLQ